MTALLAIENANLDDQVTISGNADASSFSADAQVCGLAKGEVWTLRDLLGALLLYSGNDAATAIAEYVGGSEEAFVNMMNRRAQELMANGTHFMNPHGLHDDNHYTTAYDLYLIFNECIKHEDLVNIIQSEAYTAYYTDVDGMITDVPGLILATFYADCVPLYFVDPVHRAIGLAHSGWRGTVAGMGACMVRYMQEHFNSRPEELVAAIGPSICVDCYEVSEEVAEQFREGFPEDVLQPGKAPGKYQLDLWKANQSILLRVGIPPEHMAVTNVCTCHNPEYLFSHRASHGQRGNLAAFLMLKES